MKKTKISKRARAAKRELLHRSLARKHLEHFVSYTFPAYSWSWHHRAICARLDRWIATPGDRLIVVAPPRHGKALEVSTPIPTPGGWKAIGEIRPGDEVFAGDGSMTRVVAVSPVWRDRPVYAVADSRTGDGDPIVADGEHEWVVRLDRSGDVFSTQTTARLAVRQTQMRDFRAPMVPCHGGLRLPDSDDLPIPPYTLGAWLGDGSSGYGAITQCGEDCEHVLSRIVNDGFVLRRHACEQNFGILGLKKPLRLAGLLRNKHIPPAYLRAGTGQRLALLQGLIDTDGHVTPDGQVEFCSTSKRLADGVLELVRSFGVKASLIHGRATLNGRDCGAKYRVMFYMVGAASSPRKRDRCKNGTRSPGHYLRVDSLSDRRADTVCIQVDHPSHTFLAGRAMIPTHNSELVSRKLPAFILGRFPDAQIIACSYGADLASRMNRDVQRVMDDERYRRLFPDTGLFGKNIRTMASGTWMRNSDLFEVVGRRGSYRSAGVGGGITGMGFDYGIIDDPVKSAAEAGSSVMRETVWEWYTSTFYTRQHTGARILLTLTRWHFSDLAGRLLELPEEDPTADRWDVLHLPAFANDYPAPALSQEDAQEQCFHDEMDALAAAGDQEGALVTRAIYNDWLEDHPHRKPGRRPMLDKRKRDDALWPDRYGADFLNKTRSTLGPYQFAALYGGNPTPREGGLFTLAGLSHSVAALPAAVRARCRVWDKGYAAEGDFTVGVRMSRTFDDTYIIEDIVRIREHPTRRNEVIRETARLDDALFNERVPIHVEQPPGAGSETTNLLIRTLAGHHVRSFRPVGDKAERAEPLADQFEAGNVSFLLTRETAAAVKQAREEMMQFPSGQFDDVIDACSGAFNILSSPRRLNVGL